MNRHGKPTPARMEPIRMKGRRRPQRVRVLSEIQPKRGSVNASMKRLAPSERLTWVGVNPRNTLNTGLAKLLYSQCPKISVVPPRAYAALASAGTLSGTTAFATSAAGASVTSVVTDVMCSPRARRTALGARTCGQHIDRKRQPWDLWIGLGGSGDRAQHAPERTPRAWIHTKVAGHE